MGRFFDYDGPLMRGISHFADLMWLGLLTLLFCIPVVTAGASITAMYYAVFQMRDGDKGTVWSNFWSGFRTNFLQSTLLWLLMIVAFGILYGDLIILTRSVYTFSTTYKVMTGLVAFVIIITCAFVFPLQARFENSWRQILKNSFLMGMFHLPKTVLIVFLHMVPYAVLLLYPQSFPAVLVLGLSAPAYFNAVLLLKIFQIYMPSETESSKDDNQASDVCADENTSCQPEPIAQKELDRGKHNEEES